MPSLAETQRCLPEFTDGRAMRGQVQQLHHAPGLLLDRGVVEPRDAAEVPQGLLDVELIVQPQLLQTALRRVMGGMTRSARPAWPGPHFVDLEQSSLQDGLPISISNE